ncbi:MULTISPECIES: replication initiation and membrane attachment family protein [Staphylococcus]|uniref:replication initiation and membrane attachment family protein n=1 Tax=Staphylococcus TaxID=1279 RepID=UPI0002463674|nr:MULTISPECIES: replication initiation and membrane attachment family protein [Staphylococcus]AGZ24557.1 replication initiation and membrane attachment protein, DnaB/DnaD family [Staphylococcus pasteuri SP1]MBN6852444.1 replication initiation and membrane attachment family protein [Staphylococcus warneri]MBX7840613.1 replication initiation and membrane attachment family protein [Staphylococcus warneri]MCF7594348.1 replication initiation and membrane attachment family protein [Staphylococcus wa
MGLNSFELGLRPQDSFEVIQDFHLNSQHLEILNRLFTPLIGPQAIGLYHFMHQFSNDIEQPLTHYVIMNELKENLIDFRNQMDLLEAIGLMKSFVKHDEQQTHFIYQLIQPPSPSQFFNDPMLSVFLYSEVDKKRYQVLKKHFEQTVRDLSQYQQTTRKFTDVFKVPNRILDIDTQNIPKASDYQGLDLSNESFDFDMLKQMLHNHFISNEIVTKDAKSLIVQLATLYGLTADAMKHIILNSITSAQQLSFEEMRKQARSYYLIEHENQLPKLELNKNIKPSDISTQNNEIPDPENDTEQWLQLLEQTSPIDMLASWSESEPTLSQKNMIEELIHREKMNFGVINILLQFVMLKEDMKLPKSYIFEIASNWKKKGITTAKQAYEYALKVNQPKPSYEHKSQSYQGYNRKSKLVSREKTPKWLEERDNPNATDLSKDEKDEQFERDRQAFLEQLNKDWEED